MQKLKTYFSRHLQVFFYTLGQFAEQKVTTALTVLALGIGLSIPAILFSVADSLSSFGGQWQSRPQISLYLHKDAEESNIASLIETLSKEALVESTQHITAEQGLNEFVQNGAFKVTLSLFSENPLPDVVVVYPTEEITLEQIQTLTNAYQEIDIIQQAQYDLDWLKRLIAIQTVIKRIVAILAVIIGVGIVLLIANTIRLEITNRKNEIDIIDQLGGTSSFIKRPFLYLGMLEGFLGGVCALVISALVLLLLAKPIANLSHLYGIELGLSNLSWLIALSLLLTSSVLGWAAAQFTVTRALNELKPV